MILVCTDAPRAGPAPFAGAVREGPRASRSAYAARSTSLVGLVPVVFVPSVATTSPLPTIGAFVASGTTLALVSALKTSTRSS
jgi:hypothetical protein